MWLITKHILVSYACLWKHVTEHWTGRIRKVRYLSFAPKWRENTLILRQCCVSMHRPTVKWKLLIGWLACFRCTLNGVDQDYYNDLPGKIPPDAGPPPVPPLPNLHPALSLASASTGAVATASCPATSDTVTRDHQHPALQRTQSNRVAGGSCRGEHSYHLF
jgi:hypothetical protein